MESIAERKCLHDQGGDMHEFKAVAKVLLEVELPVLGQFNSNYKSGIEYAEDFAEDEILDVLPRNYKADVKDITILSYEHKPQEREVEHD